MTPLRHGEADEAGLDAILTGNAALQSNLPGSGAWPHVQAWISTYMYDDAATDRLLYTAPGDVMHYFRGPYLGAQLLRAFGVMIASPSDVIRSEGLLSQPVAASYTSGLFTPSCLTQPDLLEGCAC